MSKAILVPGFGITSYLGWHGNPLAKDDVFERGVLFRTTESRHRYILFNHSMIDGEHPDITYSTVSNRPSTASRFRWKFIEEFVPDCDVVLFRKAIIAWALRHGVNLTEKEFSRGDDCSRAHTLRW